MMLVWDGDKMLEGEEAEAYMEAIRVKRDKARTKAEFILAGLTDDETWALRQALAKPGFYYGDGGTIHGNMSLDVEVYKGKVVSVWYRCAMLPFEEHKVNKQRAEEMRNGTDLPAINGIELLHSARLND